MLKRLKTKFILINMALVTFVLVIVLTVNLISTYQVEKREIYSSLDRVLEINNKTFNQNPGEFSTNPEGNEPPEQNPGEFSTNPNEGGQSEQNPIENGKEERNTNPNMFDNELPQIYAFSVTVDNNGEIINTFAFNSEMSETDIKKAVNRVLENKNESGTIKEYELIYKLKNIEENKIQISFSSLKSLNEKMSRTFMVSLLIFVVGFSLLFLVSFILSSYAIKPISVAWEKQKRFIADASHDLKTPLTVILANCNILESHKEERINEEIKWIESTKEESAKMKGMVENMLDLSKTENLKDKLVLSDVNISNVVDECSMKMDSLAFESGTSIDVDTEKDIIINSNVDALSKLFSILLDNAIKYAKKESIIKINLVKKKKEVIFSINNQGEKISEKDIPHLFDRFYRTDESRTESGYGLGLSIAKNIVDALNANIKVESSDEKGTTFTVTFKQ